jgi:uncharacterized membrane protein YesL
MEMRGMMGGLYRLSEWIMRLSVTNVLWLIAAFPFWLVIGYAFIGAQTIDDPAALTDILKFFVVILAIIAPFTLFPATSAMFSVARKWVLGDTDVPLFKTFFRSYKNNYKQAMIGGIFYAVLFAILIIDYQVYIREIEGLQFIAYLFVALMLILLISFLHFFSLLAHFHMKTLQLFKNALVLTIGRPVRSLMMVLGVVAITYISTKFTFLLPFFFGSLIAVYTFYNFNLVIAKMMLAKEAAEMEAATGAGDDVDSNEKTKSVDLLKKS